MKKIVGIIALVFLITTSYAQQGYGRKGANVQNFTPEQKAELMTKRMTLMLDLTKSQANEIYTLALEKAKKQKALRNNKDENKTLTKEELFSRKSERLDNQIAFKKEMKRILNAEQYEKWEKHQYRKQKGIKHKKMGNQTQNKRNY